MVFASDGYDDIGVPSTTPKYYTNLDMTGVYSGYPLKRTFQVPSKTGTIDAIQGGLTETYAFSSLNGPIDQSKYDEHKSQVIKMQAPDDENGTPFTPAISTGTSSCWGTFDQYFYEKCEPSENCTQGQSGVQLLDKVTTAMKAPLIGQLATDGAKFDPLVSSTFTVLAMAVERDRR